MRAKLFNKIAAISFAITFFPGVLAGCSGPFTLEMCRLLRDWLF